MGEKPKARDDAGKISPEDKQKAQSARFIEAAREAGVDETGTSFERAMKAMSRTEK